MTDLPVYYDNANQVIPLPVEFTAANGADTDPATVILTVTDPHGTATIYTYSSGGSGFNVIIKDSVGNYHMDLQPYSTPSIPQGLWSYTWAGAGGLVANGAQVFARAFRVLALSQAGFGKNQWYCSMEELKSRLQIKQTDTKDDYEMQIVLQAVTDWITQYCGRHFYRITETRTFAPVEGIWTLTIDDIVSATSVDLDYDGDGVYETHWTEGHDYQLLRYMNNYNVNDHGIAQPRNYLQVINPANVTANPAGGQWLPWIWPFTRRDRVSITGIWGWPDVPSGVSQASLYIAAEMFKAKDSPFGVAGIGDLGIIKIQASPWVVELLRPYKNVRKTVGV